MKKSRQTLMLVFVGLTIAFSFANPFLAQGSTLSTLSGQVVQGTTDGVLLPNTEVTLRTTLPGQLEDIRKTTTELGGYFRFEGLRQDALLFRVSVQHRGIEYAEEFGAEDDLSDVRLTVYETTSDMSLLKIQSNSILVSLNEQATRSLAFMEFITIQNESDLAFVPDQSDTMNFLRFSLPRGALNLDIQSELPVGQAIQVDRGFGLTSPVPPGVFGIAFTYTAPYGGDSFSLSRVFRLGVDIFRVHIPSSVGDISSSSMFLSDNEIMGRGAFTLLEADTIVVGVPVGFDVINLAQPTMWSRIEGTIKDRSGVVIIPFLTVVVLFVLLFLGYRKHTSGSLYSAIESSGSYSDLVLAIAALDDQFSDGKLEANDYSARREMMKKQLAVLISQRPES